MDEVQKRNLVVEHAQLTAAVAAGKHEHRARLNEIEALLNMQPHEIADLAVREYLRDY